VGCEKHTDGPVTPSTAPEAGSAEHYLPGDRAKPQSLPKVPPATKPTVPLAKDVSCVSAECHANLADAKQIHLPVAEKACNACHEDDAGGHRYPIKRAGNQTCTFCHMTVAGTQQHQHGALKQGCLSCHSPHVSNAKFLLKQDTIEQTCGTCHKTPLMKFAHEPFAKGQCTLCHQPHQSEFAKLLRGGEGPQHCYSCHTDVRNKIATAFDVHRPARKDCGSCHSPHSTEFPEQLKAQQDQQCFTCHNKIKKKVENSNVKHAAMTVQKQCSNCHDPHGAPQKSLLKARMDKVCLTCHAKPIIAQDGRTIAGMAAVLTESKFLHGANKVGNCAACHDPHGENRERLLERNFPQGFYARFDVTKYELCWSCHPREMVLTENSTITNFRDGEKNLHFVHVNRDQKGRSCKTCHEIHGSNLPNHMASEVPFEGSGWAMPIEYQQRTDGGSCAPGCHVPRTYTRGPTTLPTTMPAGTTTRGAS
jgi:predicted CXXCH cytochrome family protein